MINSGICKQNNKDSGAKVKGSNSVVNWPLANKQFGEPTSRMYTK